jgi:hypothetical protein
VGKRSGKTLSVGGKRSAKGAGTSSPGVIKKAISKIMKRKKGE